METNSESPSAPDPLAGRIDRLQQRIAVLEANAQADATSSDERQKRAQLRQERDVRRDRRAVFLIIVLALLAVGVLCLIGLSIHYRHDVDTMRLQLDDSARAAAARAASTATAGAAAQPEAAARDIIERYIDQQTSAAGAPGPAVSISVSGVIDIVKALGKAGAISAKTVSDLTAELTKQGADVAAHTVKALVDRYLKAPTAPPSPPERAGTGCCCTCPSVTVNLDGPARGGPASGPGPQTGKPKHVPGPTVKCGQSPAVAQSAER